jgi:transcriptional regulator with XRE-family HTH domain
MGIPVTKVRSKLGRDLLDSRKRKFPGDTQKAFAKRIGVGRATLQRMEDGDLSVSMGKYLAAARVLGLEAKFNDLLRSEVSLFDE